MVECCFVVVWPFFIVKCLVSMSCLALYNLYFSFYHLLYELAFILLAIHIYVDSHSLWWIYIWTSNFLHCDEYMNHMSMIFATMKSFSSSNELMCFLYWCASITRAWFLVQQCAWSQRVVPFLGLLQCPDFSVHSLLFIIVEIIFSISWSEIHWNIYANNCSSIIGYRFCSCSGA